MCSTTTVSHTRQPPPQPLNSVTDKSYYPKIGQIHPPAVLMRPKGGTGNQLFQYACHYNIARKHNWPLYVMLPREYSRGMSNRTWATLQREFALDQFHIPLHDWNIVNESWNTTGGHAVTDFEMLQGDYPLDKVIQQGGDDYCQSEAFFSSYRDELLEYFVQKIEIDPIKDWIKKIDEAEESVGVHVRRGDFLPIGVSIPLSFHRNSMNRIVERLRGRKVAFFLFSDDIEYVEKNLFSEQNDFPRRFEVYHVTDPKQPNSLQDLFLMSRCKHQIIADSSFSWWGAYLNRNTQKIVYAAHHPSSSIEKMYPKWSRAMYTWEYKYLYYPSSWIAADPKLDDIDSDVNEIQLNKLKKKLTPRTHT